MDVTGIILADGKNPKLGGNKGTELIGGIPVIERVIKRYYYLFKTKRY